MRELSGEMEMVSILICVEVAGVCVCVCVSYLQNHRAILQRFVYFIVCEVHLSVKAAHSVTHVCISAPVLRRPCEVRTLTFGKIGPGSWGPAAASPAPINGLICMPCCGPVASPACALKHLEHAQQNTPICLPAAGNGLVAPGPPSDWRPPGR